MRFGILGCELVRKTRMAVAVIPECSRSLAERRPDDDHSRRVLFWLDHMAGLASFACEGMPGRDIPVLRLCAERRSSGSGCEHQSNSRWAHGHSPSHLALPAARQ